MCQKTGDLDLQGQIGLETRKFCVIPCATTFEQWEFYFQT